MAPNSRSRSLSYSEVSTAMTCWAQWDYAYGGRLAGDALHSRQVAPILSGGRAWGAAVAVWHSLAPTEGLTLPGLSRAHNAAWDSLVADAEEQRELGFHVPPDDLVAQSDVLSAILDHYCATAARLEGLSLIEKELNVPLPARTGGRSSSRYRFRCFLDGHTEQDGHPWVVEFKLRGQLTPFELVEKMPQYRWYAWARARELGWSGPIGVLVDERLSLAPAPPRLVKAKRKGEGVNGMVVSHSADQVTTPELYTARCQEFGQEPSPTAIQAFQGRVWQVRHRLILTPDELVAAGQELASAAWLVRDLDAGRLTPIRNGKRANCGGCRFKPICSDPSNEFAVNALFERRPPKRDRGKVAAA